jgi:hypothetical protein
MKLTLKSAHFTTTLLDVVQRWSSCIKSYEHVLKIILQQQKCVAFALLQQQKFDN